MKLLIDTNVFIPSEPTRPSDIAADTPLALTLQRLANEGAHQLLVHPTARADIENDRDQQRRDMRRTLAQRYILLQDAPALTAVETVIEPAAEGTNNWVDHHHLAAIQAHAADYLVTQDDGIHRKARRLGIHDRVVRLPDAISMLRDLAERRTTPPHAVNDVPLYTIATADAIFDSLRADYTPFNDWLERSKREHRRAWHIQIDGETAGICIYKPEQSPEPGIVGKTLKLCTFKVADGFRGDRLGELLLKAAFAYAGDNSYNWIYLTAFERHTFLIDFLAESGFESTGHRNSRGELVLAKPLCVPPENSTRDSLAFHRRFGPWNVRLALAPAFVVPIRPVYHQLLFPEVEAQRRLFPEMNTFGSSIRKAYLCHAATRRIAPGSLLLFYRSEDNQHVQVLGVAEETLVSNEAERITPYVARRTVYTNAEIRDMCGMSDVLAILFRQALVLKNSLTLAELTRGNVLSAPPQSIVGIPQERVEWLQSEVQARSR